jgi:hypothetical protein
MMPRKSNGPDSRTITYLTLPGSSRRYQRVNVEECTVWVQTNLTFDLEVRGPDQTIETKPFKVDTFCEHRGAVEPTLYLTPNGKWVRRISSHELPSLKPKPPLFIQVTEAFATKWLWANGYPVPGAAAPVEANARIRNRRAPSPEQQYAHQLSREGYLSQAEIAREIELHFHLPYTQSHVSRAVKRVKDWLLAIKAEPPAGRARPSGGSGRGRNVPTRKASATGARVTRKVVDDRDD